MQYSCNWSNIKIIQSIIQLKNYAQVIKTILHISDHLLSFTSFINPQKNFQTKQVRKKAEPLVCRFKYNSKNLYHDTWYSYSYILKVNSPISRRYHPRFLQQFLHRRMQQRSHRSSKHRERKRREYSPRE